MTALDHGSAAVRPLRELVASLDERTIGAQIELSEIPAPPFEESQRAACLLAHFESLGLADPSVDEVGNVIGLRPGAEPDRPPLIISAHLDTVFPTGTDVRVTRDGDTLRGPGISDDARGLAALLAVGHTLERLEAALRTPLLFVGTVGEEGSGDLRGVKHLFRTDGPGIPSGGFISLDGAGLDRIVVEGLGSLRYRITVRGSGGHSWVDWGIDNPLDAVTRIGARLTELPLPTSPKTSLALARAGGGTSINAIPQEAWLEIDTRSASAGHLRRVRALIDDAVEEVLRPTPSLESSLRLIGDRPAGRTDPAAPLVLAAREATRDVGGDPQFVLSSTDANVPMSLGIPAITIGAGGEAGLAHTTNEWFRNRRGPEGIVRAVRTVLRFDAAAA